MKYQSIVQDRGSVSAFPEFLRERVYMREFFKKEGLPADLRRWNGVVGDMLEGIDTDLPIYLMIDQAELTAGSYHRRPGLHIDGYWGGDRWSHKSLQTHSSGGGRHYGEPVIPSHHRPRGRHISDPTHSPTGGLPRSHTSGSTWGTSTFSEPEAIILCSDVSASRALEGTFHGPIGDMGDCSKVRDPGLLSIDMKDHRVYAGNVTMLHESLPVPYDCRRTVVRLNVPGWSPTLH